MQRPQIDEQLRITYIIDDLQIGGAQVHLTRLAPLMAELFHVEVVSLGAKSEKLAAQFQGETKITTFDMSSIRDIRSFSYSFIKLIFHLKKTKPDVVHTYLNTSNVFGLLAARIAGVSSIVTSRRDMGHFRTGRIATIESCLSRYFAKKVFCVCNAVADATRTNENIPRNKLKVIYNGIDINRLQPKQNYLLDSKIHFAMVASMNREIKGHNDFIEAIKIFSEENINKAIFHLVGDGPLLPGLKKIVHEFELNSCVIFHGERSNVLPILKRIDVLVVPSHSEGISNAILEAMALGIPIIATNIDGNKETVVHQETGILVPAKKTVDLAKSFQLYIENKDLLISHGIAARKRVTTMFSLQKMQDSFTAAYIEVYS